MSLAARTPSVGAMREAVVRLLTLKGYELDPAPRLFRYDENTERGVYLFWNDAWVVVLYSAMFEEGERLIFELQKLDVPLLRIWTFDSDLWGYTLLRGRDELDNFETATGAWHGRPRTYDAAALLCETLGMPEQTQAVAKAARQRAVFAESVCQDFCAALGAAPAGLGWSDIELGAGGVQRAGGFEVEALNFSRPKPARPPRDRELHGYQFRAHQPYQPEGFPVPPELEAQMQRILWIGYVMRVLLSPIGLVVRACVWVILWKHRLFPGWKSAAGGRMHPDFVRLLEDLTALEPAHMRVDGEWLVNDRYECRIRLPDGARPQQSFPMPMVFGIEMPEVLVRCEALRPGELDSHFRLPPHASVARDEAFFAGPLQARLISLRIEGPHRDPWTVTNAWVQAPGRLYQFHAFPRGRDPVDVELVLRSVAETLLDERPASIGT
ncbi:MAG TPA: hypothetical protein VHB77_19435 [Planctomycetaceae bacterium]|nr:hypothetical protein [Planctomycetaceae bacterium]